MSTFAMRRTVKAVTMMRMMTIMMMVGRSNSIDDR
jgi:hypothetical protein